jgi:paraquat-inducible protein B
MKESANRAGDDLSAVPEAQIDSQHGMGAWTKRAAAAMWWLAALCLLVAVGVLIWAFQEVGAAITIHFQQGHGLKPGDALRHRGIEVGEVERVKLEPDLRGVLVRIRLQPDAVGLAREGSRFWIERPQVSLSRVTGLETVMGAKFVAVIPGPAHARAAYDFEGMETPLTLASQDDVEITVRFDNGHGLTTGSSVRHRGIEVGEITSVELDEDLRGVQVVVRLVGTAARLARRGTQFWIEHPRVSLRGVRALETIVAGPYLALRPGPADAERSSSFQGLDQPPVDALGIDGGLEIILEGSHRLGLERGAPVTYRGLAVGRILSVGLSSDALRVESRVLVDPEYSRLVRANSRFWSSSGVNLHMGLSGIDVSLETIETMAAGGVGFATPDPPGAPVHTGHRFVLEEKEVDDWQSWQPSIAVGSALLPEGAARPQPVRASMSWTVRRFGIQGQRRRRGWVLPLSDGRWIAPAVVLMPPSESESGHRTIELAGVRRPWTADRIRQIDQFAVYTDEFSKSPQLTRWPIERMRVAGRPEDIVLISDPNETHLPIAAGRLSLEEGSWNVESAVALSEEWSGACAIACSDGMLIGLVTVRDGQAQVLPITANLLSG